MNVGVFFTSREVDEADVDGRLAVVIDVIRATSTMVEALANGARGIFPTRSTEEAIKLASSLGREDTILCGERKGLRIDGFDLGNSPREFTPEAVSGKQLVMTTTNGTRAFLAAEAAETVLAASLLNLSAIGEEISGASDLAIICAGRQDRFSLDDALCAGLLLKHLGEAHEGEMNLNDAGKVSLELAGNHRPDPAFLKATAAGRALEGLGLQDDLELCAHVDRHALVPKMTDRRIALLGRRGEN
ncbi:2-phosphosulfolactate phosphatase [Gemmatimonadota bacterium]